MKSIYIETTIPSLIIARQSRDLITAARQEITLLFGERERQKYEMYISHYVIDECAKGDKEAAQKRIDILSGITILSETTEITRLASVYQTLLQIPEKAKTDCFHLATCVVYKIDYLLSWNCAHLGLNSYEKIKAYNNEHGLWVPLLLTPEALTIV